MKTNEMMSKKVAIFEYVATGDMACMTGVRFVTDHDRKDTSVMRVSEWMDVEFTKRQENNVQERVDLINESTSKCLDEIGLIKAKLKELRRQKSELVGDVS